VLKQSEEVSLSNVANAKALVNKLIELLAIVDTEGSKETDIKRLEPIS